MLKPHRYVLAYSFIVASQSIGALVDDDIHVYIFNPGFPWQRHLWWAMCATSVFPNPGQMCVIRSHQQGAAVSRPVSLQRLDIRSIIKWSVSGWARTATSEYWRSCGVAQWLWSRTCHCQMDWLLTRFTGERVDCWSRFCKLQIPFTNTSCSLEVNSVVQCMFGLWMTDEILNFHSWFCYYFSFSNIVRVAISLLLCEISYGTIKYDQKQNNKSELSHPAYNGQ